MVLAQGIEDKMLTTGSSQYLHPDYLQPLPTTLDAKKSPLALLAQTCSNIGKDISANSKPVIPPLEKKDGRTSNEEETKESKRDEPKQEQPSTPPKSVIPTKEKPPSRTPESPRTTEVTTPPSESRERKSPSSVKNTPAVSLSTSTVTTSAASAGTLPLDSNLYFSHSAAVLDPLYASALAAHASLGLKPGEVSPHLPSLSPYLGFAQVKAANGATTLVPVPVCRDPYCNCQLSLRGASLPCPAGCTQCSHDKPPAAHHPMPVLPLGLPSALGSFYPSYIPTAHGLPYVCNWVSGSEHCGKRFTTSEELLRHLRTHTNCTEASPLPLSYSLPSSLSPYHGHLPSSLSPNSLHRAYPTSLSPIGHALASSRFHPYKSSLSSLSSSSLPSLPPSVPSVPFPGAYYSPYSLYSSRLGAAAAP